MATPPSWLRGLSQSRRTLVSRMAPPSTACSLMPVTRLRCAGAGNASVTFNSGTLNVSAVRPRGILAWVDGNGSATVTTGAGTVINVSGTQFGGPGVYVFSSGTATAPNALTANVASQITSVGPATTDPSNLPVGIRANNSGTNAPISVTYTGPGITTMGGNGTGILATSGSGSINVNSSGPINDEWLHAAASAERGTVLRTTTTHVSATRHGTVQVNATNVYHHGRVRHRDQRDGGQRGVTVNVAPGGSVMGGWQADLTSVGADLSVYRPPALT